MKKSRILLIFMVILFCLLLSACQSGKQQIYANYNFFGTTLKAVVYANNDSFNSFKNKCDKTLESINQALNEDIKDSDIYKFNNAKDNEIIEVSEVCYQLISKAKEIHSLTLGAYNPCVYYLVDLWGFSPRFSYNDNMQEPYDRDFDDDGFLPLPDNEYIEAFAALADFDKVKLNRQDDKYFLYKENSKMMLDGYEYYVKIDIGGLIKGYAIDVLTNEAKTLGLTKGYISYGTSSISILENKKGDSWELTLTNPRFTDKGKETFIMLPVKNKQVSSSGDYERYYEKEGKRYSHIIDASSGRPIDNGVCAVTVLCDNAMLADMLSTAFCVLGKDKTLELITAEYFVEKNIQVILTYIAGDKMEIYTSDIEYVNILDERYIIYKL